MVREAVHAGGARLLFSDSAFRVPSGNGALERVDQLNDGGEDRAVIGGKRGGVAWLHVCPLAEAAHRRADVAVEQRYSWSRGPIATPGIL